MCGVSGVGGGGNNNQVFNADRVGGNDASRGCGDRNRALVNPYGNDRFETNSSRGCGSSEESGGGMDELLSKLADKGMQVLTNPLNAVTQMLGGLFGGGGGEGGGSNPLGGIMKSLGGLVQGIMGMLGSL